MKKKLVALCLCVAMLAIAIVGGTLAYFTDTDAKTNTFTLGKVEITLTEPNYVTTENDGSLKIFPGQSYAKDPTITVAADSEDCYIVATVTVSELAALKALYANDPEVLQPWGLSLAGAGGLVSGGVADYDPTPATDNNVGGTMLSKDGAEVAFVTYAENANADTLTYTYYFKQIHSANDSEVLFDTVNVPAIITNDSLTNGIAIKVNAYAIQEIGFNDVYEAYAAYVAQNG